MLIRESLYLVFCMIAGGATSAGYVAFITLLGVFERLSEKYKVNNLLPLLEIVIIAGVSFGNALNLFQFDVIVHLPGFIIYAFFGGTFVGCLAGALAETLDVFPILSRKFKIRDFLPYVIISAATGKAFGNIINMLFM